MGRANEAPEVVVTSSPLIPVEDEINSAGLQAHNYDAKFYGNPEDKGAPGEEVAVKTSKSPVIRRWRMLAVALAVLILLAVGIGIGFAIGHKGSGSHPAQSTHAVTSTTRASPTASSTRTAATSGATGIARFSCSTEPGLNRYTSSANPDGNTEFVEQCYINYNPGSDLLDGNGTVVQLNDIITYSFHDCMDACALWTYNHKSNPCRAVTYTANLTESILGWGSNCGLKNGHCKPNSVGSDAPYWASAYVPRI